MTSAEYQDRDHPIHAQSAEHKRLVFAYVLELSKRLGAAAPEALARQVFVPQEGAIAAAQLGGTTDPAADAKAAAAQLIANAST